MLRNHRRILWQSLVFLMAGAYLTCLAGKHLTAQGEKNTSPPKTDVFVYPEKLKETDKLKDGPLGNDLPIKSETILIWVDLMPDARFAHPTEYILITTHGAQIIRGNWWPILNDKPLFREGIKYKVDFPAKLSGK